MMDSESRRRGPRSPSEESDSMRRRSKKYDRSPSPRRRYRRSRSRSRSSEREMISRRKETSKERDWKSNSQSSKASNPPNTSYPPPVVNRYNQAPPPPNTSQPPPPIAYGQGYGNYNYTYNAAYPEYNPAATNYPPTAAYRNDYPPPANWPGNMPYNPQQQHAAVAAQAAAAAAVAAPTRVVDPTAAAAQALLAATGRPEEAKKEAIAAELKQQKATIAKQREEYVKKSVRLQRELEILRKQHEEIDNEGGRENNRIIKENQKLQVEIQTKMKSIHNVIDMLTGIIGDKVTVDDLKVKYKPDAVKPSKSPKEDMKKITESPNLNEKDEERPSYNFVHYDPEMHWCKTCDIFPKTAKEYLNHLHSNEHKETCVERKIVDMPWHDDKNGGPEKEVPFYQGLPTKRTPIKGLQFFSPATAWYCKLCNTWIGDLHCASLHLKSRRHSENYSRFVEQSPHWETDWMADREKAFSDEKNKQIQLEIQKQKEEAPVVKPKKSKKAKKNKKKSKKRKNKSSNSESSSDSDSNDSDTNNGNGPTPMDDPSKSIRVAMRNKGKSSSHSSHHGSHVEDLYGYKAAAVLPQHDNHLNKPMPEPEIKPLNNAEADIQAWAPKEPPKSFWIKKDEEIKVVPQPVPAAVVKPPEEMPKPHMGFWTKQQVQPVKVDKEKEEERDSSRSDRDKYKDERREYGGKWDKRDDDYKRSYRDDRYDRRRSGRDRDYYDSRSGRHRGSDSPRHGREYSPKRSYDKYGSKRRGDDESNDEKKSGDKSKKDVSSSSSSNSKKGTPQVMKGKLPFIGRLPLFKKKDDTKQPEKEVTALPYAQSKFEDTPKVSSDIINPPGVVHVPKLATPLALSSAPKAQMKILVAPPPPVLNDKSKKPEEKPNGTSTAEPVDMEIEDQSEEVLIEQNVDPTKEVAPTTDLSKPPPIIPNTSLPPPGYVPKKVEATPTPFTPQGPPPPFVTGVANTFLHPTNQPPPAVQSMPYMHQMQMPPPNMYSAPPPQLSTTEMLPGVMVPSETTEAVEGEKRADGAPLPEDLQEALDIIFPKEETPEEKSARLAAEQAAREAQETSIMYGSMYNMLGCVGYGPDYMDLPPPEITQQEPETESAGPDDLKMLGIDEGDTIF